MPMIATTIINSMRVKPRWTFLRSFMGEHYSNGRAAANSRDQSRAASRGAEECHFRAQNYPSEICE
jgi:hypothetical protein